MATNRTPTCKNCKYMLQGIRAKTDGNNWHRGGGRAPCYCEHPAAVEAFYRVCPKSNRYAGFIDYTPCGKNGPKLKTSPVWCPLRNANKWRPLPEENEKEGQT